MQRPRRGFTIIELLTVIAIILLLLAIILPALNAVRSRARISATQSLLTDVSSAFARFQNDHRRLPGYFGPREMGAASNAARGFSAMQNAMLDLAGGLVPATATTGVAGVGPSNLAADQVRVDPGLIGSAAGVTLNGRAVDPYLLPDPRYFARLDGGTMGGRAGVAAHNQIPDLVDAFGTPILLWTKNPAASREVETLADFVATDSAAGPARFYWNSNAAFLSSSATAVGKQRINMGVRSLLGQANGTGGAPPIASLAGVLGNPSDPVGEAPTAAGYLPRSARGAFVLHSAGSNAIFVARGDTAAGDRPGGDGGGAELAFASEPRHALHYGLNFRQPGSAGARRLLNGEPNTEDIMGFFDDILVSGGR